MERQDFSRLKKNRAIYFKVGMICALCLVFLAFNYTTNEKHVFDPGSITIPDDFIIVPPPTSHPKPLPPPPPPISIKEIVPDETVEAVVLEPIDKPKEITIDDFKKLKPVEVKKPAVVKVVAPKKIEDIPEEVIDEEEVFVRVEQMPRFNACEDMEGTNQEKQTCAEQKMLAYIYKNIKYPAVARENGIEGRVTIQFVVDETGQLTEPKIVADIGGGCGKEALRVVKKMAKKKWIPGRQRNNAVKVQFNLPVTFKLK